MFPQLTFSGFNEVLVEQTHNQYWRLTGFELQTYFNWDGTSTVKFNYWTNTLYLIWQKVALWVALTRRRRCGCRCWRMTLTPSCNLVDDDVASCYASDAFHETLSSGFTLKWICRRSSRCCCCRPAWRGRGQSGSKPCNSMGFSRSLSWFGLN